MKNFCLLVIWVLVAAGNASAQNIITIAGNGTPAYTGDGGQATAAELNAPIGIAFDKTGNMYFADATNSVVRKINLAGVITTVAGNNTFGYSGDGGDATNAQLNTPTGVFVDTGGNLFIADYANQYIRKVNPSGIISTIAGIGTPGYTSDGVPATTAALNYPVAVTVDLPGNVYISDLFNHRVRKINTAGIISTFAGNGVGTYSGDAAAATAAGIPYPEGIVIDAVGTVFIAEKGDGRIRKVPTSGIIYTHAGIGVNGYSGDGVAATNAQLNQPYGLALDRTGNMYVADESNNRIRKIDLTGVISTVAGAGTAGYTGDGGPATVAELNRPCGVGVDSSGKVYIGDTWNNVIRKIVPNIALGNGNFSPGNHSVNIYPNPANSAFTIDIESVANTTEIIITDMAGRVMETRSIKNISVKEHFDAANYPNGTYIIKVVTGGNTYRERLIIAH